MTRYRLLISSLLVLVLVGCAGNIPPIQPPQPPPVQAFAIVVKDFVNPSVGVEGVAITCNQEIFGLTNADGYTVKDVISNVQYDCILSKEGYEDNTASHFATPESSTLETWIKKIPPPVLPGLQGRLRVDSSCFRDDTGCVLPVYAHSGDALSRYVRDPDYVRGQFDDVKEAGYYGVRTWGVLGGSYWAGRDVGPDVTPDYWPKVKSFLEDLSIRGLRVVWSMGDIGYLTSSRQDYMSNLANLDSTLEVVDFLDCGNEAWQTGEPSATKLAECVSYYKNAGGKALLTLTSPPGEEKAELDAYSIFPADTYDVHGYREGHFWDKIRHIFSIPYEIKPDKEFGIQSEPWGSGERVSVTENKHEIDDEVSALGAVMSALSGQAWVWFSGEGVVLVKGLNTEAGFLSAPAAVKLLPKDVTTYDRLHHSGTSQSDIRTFVVPNDDVRIDGRTDNDGRTVQVIYGPSGTYQVPVVRNFVGKICHPTTQVCDELNLSAGSTLSITFIRGRVLIGRSN